MTFSSRACLSTLFLLAPVLVEAQPAAATDTVMARSSVPLLTVTGQAEVLAPPDQAVVRIGVEAEANEATAAQTKINNAIHQAVERIRKLGIPDNAIQTAGVSLMPVYARQGQQTQTITGYRASNVLQVRVDDIARVGRVLDAAVTGGANRLDGVSFQLKNELPQRTRALQLAIDQARTKAQAMADALHIQLGPIQSVSEQGGEITPPQPLMMRANLGLSTPIEPGEIRVPASVVVAYELRPLPH